MQQALGLCKHSRLQKCHVIPEAMRRTYTPVQYAPHTLARLAAITKEKNAVTPMAGRYGTPYHAGGDDMVCQRREGSDIL
jgi:hypothetical protein